MWLSGEALRNLHFSIITSRTFTNKEGSGIYIEQDLVKLLVKELLQVVGSLDKALDKEIRKINPIEVVEKKEIKHQYVNYQKKLEIRGIKKWIRLRKNVQKNVLKKVKVKEISKQQTTKTSREVIDNQQEPQLMILNETNITDNKKIRNKNNNRTYSAIVKRLTNKDTNEKATGFQ